MSLTHTDTPLVNATPRGSCARYRTRPTFPAHALRQKENSMASASGTGEPPASAGRSRRTEACAAGVWVRGRRLRDVFTNSIWRKGRSPSSRYPLPHPRLSADFVRWRPLPWEGRSSLGGEAGDGLPTTRSSHPPGSRSLTPRPPPDQATQGIMFHESASTLGAIGGSILGETTSI